MQQSEEKELVQELAADLAKNLRSIRKAKGWSQSDLAERIGVHLTHVNRIETGKYAPNLEFVVKAASALNVSLDVLLERTKAVSSEDVEIQIQNKPMLERLRLIESLEEADQAAVFRVIDSMLTRQKMKKLLHEDPEKVAS